MAEEPRPLEMTERKKPPRDLYVGLCDRFRTYFGAPIVWWANQYWSYNGMCYESAGEFKDMQLFIDRWHQQVVTPAPVTTNTTNEIEMRLRASSFLGLKQAMPAYMGENKKHRYKTSLENGVLNLEPCLAGKMPTLVTSDAKWFTTACLPYKYVPGATCPKWLNFLKESLEDDPERIAVLQEWYGYCCTYDTSYERALLMEGPGGNGKTQALEVLRELVGRDNCSAVPLENLGDRFAPVATLGKLVNICGETKPRCSVPVATFRHLVTGEAFQFERKGMDTFQDLPTARFVIAMNERPAMYDSSDALWRRIMLMPWRYRVPPDKIILDLGKKIAATELPGVFNWAIEGLIRLWSQGHFTESTVVSAANASLRSEGDPVKTWLESKVVKCAEGYMPRNELWAELQQAVVREEIVVPDSYTALRFIADIKRVFPDITETRRRISDSYIHVWKGLKRI